MPPSKRQAQTSVHSLQVSTRSSSRRAQPQREEPAVQRVSGRLKKTTSKAVPLVSASPQVPYVLPHFADTTEGRLPVGPAYDKHGRRVDWRCEDASCGHTRCIITSTEREESIETMGGLESTEFGTLFEMDDSDEEPEPVLPSRRPRKGARQSKSKSHSPVPNSPSLYYDDSPLTSLSSTPTSSRQASSAPPPIEKVTATSPEPPPQSPSGTTPEGPEVEVQRDPSTMPTSDIVPVSEP